MLSDTGKRRGALVVVEGLDRAGKSSQCLLLQDKLETLGIPTRYIKFPDRTTPTGQMINSYLTGQAQNNDHAIHLIFSANRWEVVNSIVSDIDNGVTIIIDRYSFSGAVYSAAKDNPNLSLEWAWAPEIGLPKPDIILFLHISPQDAAKRGGFGEERYETTRMQERVRELFGQLFEKLDNEHVHTVDAGGSIEEVAHGILWPVLDCVKNLGAARLLGQLSPLRV